VSGEDRSDLLQRVEAAFAEHFGHRPARASISFLGVESIDVLRFEPVPGERAYLTSGMSRHPMTGAGELVVANDGPRAELMLHLVDPGDRFAEVWRRLALLGAAPSVEGVVYVPGMSVDLGEPLLPGTLCTGVLVVNSPLTPVHVEDTTVDVLQVLPATSSELAWCRVHGADLLRSRWSVTGTDLRDLGRGQVDLN